MLSKIANIVRGTLSRVSALEHASKSEYKQALEKLAQAEFYLRKRDAEHLLLEGFVRLSLGEKEDGEDCIKKALVSLNGEKESIDTRYLKLYGISLLLRSDPAYDTAYLAKYNTLSASIEMKNVSRHLKYKFPVLSYQPSRKSV